MKIIVLKFGGTSVGSITRIKKICKIILKHKKRDNRLIVISSAMSGTTNKLVKMSKNISKLSGRIGLKDNLFQKISERSLNSKNGDGMKELAEKNHVGLST